MSFKKSLICLGFATLAFSSVSMADTTFASSAGTVDFNGNIVNTPCAITASNQNLKVDLGNVRTSEFAKGKGSTGNQENRPFTIILSNCTVLPGDEAYTAQVTFKGLGSDGTETSLATNAGSDTSGQPVATGVGIQILSGDTSKAVVLGTPNAEIPITQTEMHLNYAAKYVSIADAVTPGLANGHVDFVVAYN